MSDDRIYVRFKGKTLGPLTTQKVQDLVRRGQVTRMHELSSDGLAWLKAEQFGEFFQSPQAASAVAPVAFNQAAAPVAATTSQLRSGELASDDVEWYAHVDNANRGPLTPAVIAKMISSGSISGQSLVWRSGYGDWQPAAKSFPEYFPGSDRFVTMDNQPASQFQGAMPTSARNGESQHSGSVSEDAIQAMVRPRGWILHLAISTLIYAALSILYCVVMMIVGSANRVVPLAGPAAVIGGLIGIIFSLILIAGATMLLQYATALKIVAIRRDQVSAMLAMKRLHTFWQYCSILLMVLQVFTVGGIILSIILVFAAAASSNS